MVKMNLESIGQVAERLGVTLRTIRFYEDRGLVRSSSSPGRTRYFDAHAVARLAHVRALQECGFTIKEIQQHFDRNPYGKIPALTAEEVTAQIDYLEQQMSRMGHRLAQLQAMVQAAGSAVNDAMPSVATLVNQPA